MKILSAIVVFFISLNLFAMGIPRSKPKPNPTPQLPPFQGEFWLASNVATPDFMSMFTQPELWQNTRQRVKIMQFYAQSFVEACPRCGPNTLDNYKAHNIFETMKNWNIEMAVETGAVKDWDCTGNSNKEYTRQLLQNLSQVAAPLRYISMDEPFVSGLSLCSGQSGEQVADSVASYIRSSKKHSQTYFPNSNVQIGLIEAYPHFRGDQIAWFLQLLHERGAMPAFLHLDIDHWALRGKSMGDAQVASDLKLLLNKCRELNIPFGVVYWGHDGDDASKFRTDVLDLAALVKRTLGQPDRAIVQSWATTKVGDHLVNPPNLPENNPQSLTGILQSLLGLL